MPTNTNEWLKNIQRLTGTPGNQSPAIKEIVETPAATETNPEDEVPDGPVVERKVISEGGKSAKESTETGSQGGKKATDSNDIQRAGRDSRGKTS